jgi:hypothetical protein
MAEQDRSGVRALALHPEMPDRLRAFLEARATMPIVAFLARLDALLSATQQRLIALEEWRANGEDLAVDTRAEGLTDALEAIQSDRMASQEDQDLARLDRRLDALQQMQGSERSQQRDQGMRY